MENHHKFAYHEISQLKKDGVLNEIESFKTYLEYFLRSYEEFQSKSKIDDVGLFEDSYRILRNILFDLERFNQINLLDSIHTYIVNTKQSKSPKNPKKKQKLTKEEKDEQKEATDLVVFKKKADKLGLPVSENITLRKKDLPPDEIKAAYRAVFLPEIQLVEEKKIVVSMRNHPLYVPIQQLLGCKNELGYTNEQFWHMCNVLAKDWALLSSANFVTPPLYYQPAEFLSTVLQEEEKGDDVATSIAKKDQIGKNIEERVHIWLKEHSEYPDQDLYSIIESHLIEDQLALQILAELVTKTDAVKIFSNIEHLIENSNFSTFSFKTLNYANYYEVLSIFADADDDILLHVKETMYDVIQTQVGFKCFDEKATQYWQFVDNNYRKKQQHDSRKRGLAPDLGDSNVCLSLKYLSIDNVILDAVELDQGTCIRDKHLDQIWKVPQSLMFGELYLRYRYRKPRPLGPKCPSCQSKMRFVIASGIQKNNIDRFWQEKDMDHENIATIPTAPKSMHCKCNFYFKKPNIQCSYKMKEYTYLCNAVQQLHTKYSSNITPKSSHTKCENLFEVVMTEEKKHSSDEQLGVPLLKCAYEYIKFMYDYAVAHNQEKMKGKIDQVFSDSRVSLFYCTECKIHICYKCIVSDKYENADSDETDSEQAISFPEAILAHRERSKKTGDTFFEFNVKWLDGEPTWEPTQSLEKLPIFHEYVEKNNIPVKIFNVELENNDADRKQFQKTFEKYINTNLKINKISHTLRITDAEQGDQEDHGSDTTDDTPHSPIWMDTDEI